MNNNTMIVIGHRSEPTVKLYLQGRFGGNVKPIADIHVPEGNELDGYTEARKLAKEIANRWNTNTNNKNS